MPLAPGTRAPDFTLPSTDGTQFSLDRDLSGQPCLLYFYFKDFTVGCTNEACGFRDTFDTFDSLNIPVLGISRDDLASHQKFKAMLGLPFELLVDEGARVSEAYQTTVPLINFTKRTTYLLDKDHLVVAAYENIFSSRHHIKAMVDKVLSGAVTV